MNYFSSEFTEENRVGSHRIKVTGIPIRIVTLLQFEPIIVSSCKSYAYAQFYQQIQNQAFPRFFLQFLQVH